MDFSSYLKYKGIKLTEQQNKIVNHIDGPMLSLAVPGAGKTTTTCIRVGNLIFNHGISSDRILTMTFSRASARDMNDRFQSIFEDLIRENNIKVRFSTIHSFAYEIVRRFYRYNEMIEDKDAKETKAQILKKIYKQITSEYIGEDKYEELTTGISYIKNKMLDIDNIDSDILSDICSIDSFKDVFKRYESYKNINRYIDYDDMLTISYNILKNDDKVLKLYRDRFDYLQLDEAQDTSNIQFAIVEFLAAPKYNICYVADDDQSIYGFRASEVSYLLHFKEMHPEGIIYFMEQNFRSTKDIIEVSNEFIKGNKFRYEKNMFTNKNYQRPITVVEVEDEINELDYIVEKIMESNQYDDNAIIYRNNLLSIPLVDALNKHRIPFYIREQDNKFFSHWLVQDILSFLRLALNPNDFESFLRIYYKGNLFLSKDIVNRSRNYNDGCGVLESILRVPEIEDYKKVNIHRMKHNLKKLSTSSGQSIVDTILIDMGYKDYLERNAKSQGYSYENLITLATTLNLIIRSCNNIRDIFKKLDDVQLLMKNSSYNRGKNVVTLTTAHGAKGLEYNRVFIMSMNDGIFPSTQAELKEIKGDTSLIEEERRLFYVSMTRGRHYVDIMTLKFKNGVMASPSKFVKEVELILNGGKESDELELKIGDIVNHKQFGKGKVAIVDMKENLITVLFSNSGLKRLSYDLCISKGLLKKEM